MQMPGKHYGCDTKSMCATPCVDWAAHTHRRTEQVTQEAASLHKFEAAKHYGKYLPVSSAAVGGHLLNSTHLITTQH